MPRIFRSSLQFSLFSLFSSVFRRLLMFFRIFRFFFCFRSLSQFPAVCRSFSQFFAIFRSFPQFSQLLQFSAVCRSFAQFFAIPRSFSQFPKFSAFFRSFRSSIASFLLFDAVAEVSTIFHMFRHSSAIISRVGITAAHLFSCSAHPCAVFRSYAQLPAYFAVLVAFWKVARGRIFCRFAYFAASPRRIYKVSKFLRMFLFPPH